MNRFLHGVALTILILAGVPRAQAQLGTGATMVAAGGSHICAVTNVGQVQCWGDNTHGQLGIGSTSPSTTPALVSGLGSQSVIAVSAGQYRTCVLTSTGTVSCWGDNTHGQLGNGNTTQSPSPVAVSGLASGVTRISAGEYHTCAVVGAGTVYCWGSNNFGELGNGTAARSTTPVRVPLNGTVTGISAGGGHTCAVSSG